MNRCDSKFQGFSLSVACSFESWHKRLFLYAYTMYELCTLKMQYNIIIFYHKTHDEWNTNDDLRKPKIKVHSALIISAQILKNVNTLNRIV